MTLIRMVAVALSVAFAAGCSSATEPRPAALPTAVQSEVLVKIRTVKKTHLGLGLQQQLRFAEVTLADQALAAQINKRLRAAAEDVLDAFQQEIADYRDTEGGGEHPTALLRSYATIGLRGPNVLSVRYAFSADGDELGRIPSIAHKVVVMDLATGRELGVREMLSPEADTPDGAARLTRLLAEKGPGGRLCEDGPEIVAPLPRGGIFADRPEDALIKIFPTPEGMRFMLALAKAGYPMSCAVQEITVGYGSLGDLLAPGIRWNQVHR